MTCLSLSYRSLDFGSNQFSGTLPAQLGAMSLLQYVGMIEMIALPVHTTEPCMLWPAINVPDWCPCRSLTLSNNNFSGSLPTTLTSWTSLTYVSLRVIFDPGPRLLLARRVLLTRRSIGFFPAGTWTCRPMPYLAPFPMPCLP